MSNIPVFVEEAKILPTVLKLSDGSTIEVKIVPPSVIYRNTEQFDEMGNPAYSVPGVQLLWSVREVPESLKIRKN